MSEIDLKKLRFDNALTQEELGNILGVTKQHIGRLEKGISKLSEEKKELLIKKFGLQCNKVTNDVTLNNSSDIIQISYWAGLPEELKHPEYTYVLAQRISIEQGWGVNPDDLCIIPMVGDKMAMYWYPIRNNDMLIIDTGVKHIMGNGVYFATSQNNTRFWVREMQNLINNDVQIKAFAPSGETVKTFTRQQLTDVDFKVIGKVIKNVSFRL